MSTRKYSAPEIPVEEEGHVFLPHALKRGKANNYFNLTQAYP
jgi:hypothetical protein